MRASARTFPCHFPAGFLQRGPQLRGDTVAHNPNYVARRSGNDVGADPSVATMAAGGRLSPIVKENLARA